MKKAALIFSIILALSLWTAAGQETPLLEDLRKPVEEVVEVVDDVPVVPGAVSPANRIDDPARVCPAGAVWYAAIPDSGRFSADWENSPPGLFMGEPAVRQTVRNNRFGLSFLFSDLPESVITRERVGTIASAMELAAVLSEKSGKMAFAAYIDDEGMFSFAYLFDIGLNREEAFDVINNWETSLHIAYPGTAVRRGNHADSYLDIWTLRNENEMLRPSEIAAGFIENIAIVTNDRVLAENCAGLTRGGANVADSSWGRRLAASVAASSTADAMCYLRMDAILDGLKQTPIARQSVLAWADYIGHGGKDGEAIYYGIQFTPDGSRETLLLPPGEAVASSLIELLAKRIRPASKWTAANVLPYQPNPSLFFAANLEGRQLGGLLRQERRLFGISVEDSSFQMPPDGRRLFTNDVVAQLTGEVGMAFYPDSDGKPMWLMILPCNSNVEKALPRSEQQIERSGGLIHSRVSDWRTNLSWAVIPQDVFRRAGGDFLIIASQGDLILSTIDQLISGSSFAANKDFSEAVSRAEAGHGLLFYINMPEIMVRIYPDLSSIMRQIYPRSSGLNSRPPLALIRRYSKGILGAIMPSGNGNGNGNGNGLAFTRVTIQSPVPMMGVLAASTVLRFPMAMRSDGRMAMRKSQENLQALWLRLQLYSSRYGHFPESLDALMADVRTTMTQEEVRSLFTAPAALSRLSPLEAMNASYLYLSGVTPNDEPDLPIIYEAQPWSEDFSGIFPTDPNRSPSETGVFQPYRQFIRLDGRVVAMPEKRFQDRMVTRMQERE